MQPKPLKLREHIPTTKQDAAQLYREAQVLSRIGRTSEAAKLATIANQVTANLKAVRLT